MNRILSPLHTHKERQTTRHSHVGRKGDLVIELHYGNFGTGRKHEAALYIYQLNRQAEGTFVPMTTLWQFAERDAMHTIIPPLAQQIFAYVTKQDCYRLLDAILDFLEDLKNARPDPNLFKDRSLDAFLESCAQEGLEFFVQHGKDGRKQVLN